MICLSSLMLSLLAVCSTGSFVRPKVIAHERFEAKVAFPSGTTQPFNFAIGKTDTFAIEKNTFEKGHCYLSGRGVLAKLDRMSARTAQHIYSGGQWRPAWVSCNGIKHVFAPRSVRRLEPRPSGNNDSTSIVFRSLFDDQRAMETVKCEDLVNDPAFKRSDFVTWVGETCGTSLDPAVEIKVPAGPALAQKNTRRGDTYVKAYDATDQSYPYLDFSTERAGWTSYPNGKYDLYCNGVGINLGSVDLAWNSQLDEKVTNFQTEAIDLHTFCSVMKIERKNTLKIRDGKLEITSIKGAETATLSLAMSPAANSAAATGANPGAAARTEDTPRIISYEQSIMSKSFKSFVDRFDTFEYGFYSWTKMHWNESNALEFLQYEGMVEQIFKELAVEIQEISVVDPAKSTAHLSDIERQFTKPKLSLNFGFASQSADQIADGQLLQNCEITGDGISAFLSRFNSATAGNWIPRWFSCNGKTFAFTKGMAHYGVNELNANLHFVGTTALEIDSNASCHNLLSSAFLNKSLFFEILADTCKQPVDDTRVMLRDSKSTLGTPHANHRRSYVKPGLVDGSPGDNCIHDYVDSQKRWSLICDPIGSLPGLYRSGITTEPNGSKWKDIRSMYRYFRPQTFKENIITEYPNTIDLTEGAIRLLHCGDRSFTKEDAKKSETFLAFETRYDFLKREMSSIIGSNTDILADLSVKPFMLRTMCAEVNLRDDTTPAQSSGDHDPKVLHLPL